MDEMPQANQQPNLEPLFRSFLTELREVIRQELTGQQSIAGGPATQRDVLAPLGITSQSQLNGLVQQVNTQNTLEEIRDGVNRLVEIAEQWLAQNGQG